jgi:hypothetical protein
LLRQETQSNVSKYVPTSDYLTRYPRQTVTRVVVQYVDQSQVRRRQRNVARALCATTATPMPVSWLNSMVARDPLRGGSEDVVRAYVPH